MDWSALPTFVRPELAQPLCARNAQYWSAYWQVQKPLRQRDPERNRFEQMDMNICYTGCRLSGKPSKRQCDQSGISSITYGT